VVKFYDEKTGAFIAVDQPVSVLSRSTDDVFIDWKAEGIGSHPIAIRVFPWKTDGDDPSNNKVTRNVYVDIDSDGDGVGNRSDNDDDNDGVADGNDAFPLNRSEWADTDGDGIGDNADSDDDNDGVPDAEDAFPRDPNETVDTDLDGTGNNGDPFPDDPSEWADSDKDGLGDNADPNDSNHGPIPSIQVEKTQVKAGETVTFNALESSDPDGAITTYRWTFGDGMVGEGSIVDHEFSKRGTYLTTLEVTDNSGESRVLSVTMTVGLNLFFLLWVLVTALLVFLFLLGLVFRRRDEDVVRPRFSPAPMPPSPMPPAPRPASWSRPSPPSGEEKPRPKKPVAGFRITRVE
jgi:hypothetical protein